MGRLDEIPHRIGAHVDAFLEFYQVLDEGREARIRQEIREKLDRMPLQSKTSREKAGQHADS